jgi:hypothetical protein
LKQFFSFFLLLSTVLTPFEGNTKQNQSILRFEFWGDTIDLPFDSSILVPYTDSLTAGSVAKFHQNINQARFGILMDGLLAYKREKLLDDWLYYQLLRKVANELAPKSTNYQRYTLYKWFLLVKSGYDATVNIFHNQLLLYVYSNDAVYDIPLYTKNNRQYVCLNMHDYATATQQTPGATLQGINLPEPKAVSPFTYTITRIPQVNRNTYAEKDIHFPYGPTESSIKVMLSTAVSNIFTNYPVVNFEAYFNIPMSGITSKSLLPILKNNTKSMTVEAGVEYLMHFTRYAFLYETDQKNFGKEKRMGPEETLIAASSDCDDRAALFFYLVKELYNLPMITLMFPTHLTIAVQFAHPVGQVVLHKGRAYSICEPTPQAGALAVGNMAPQYQQQPFSVVYAYQPDTPR